MGASDERLEAYCQIYHEQNRLVPVPEPIGQITRDNWREFLGQREREGDYRAFFAGEVARLGATPAAVHYLPQLMPGMAASALHAFMRMAYATMTDSDEETGVALGYWAATYLRSARRKAARRRPTIRPKFSPSCMGRRRSGRSRPSATCSGISCARSRSNPNSRPSSTSRDRSGDA